MNDFTDVIRKAKDGDDDASTQIIEQVSDYIRSIVNEYDPERASTNKVSADECYNHTLFKIYTRVIPSFNVDIEKDTKFNFLRFLSYCKRCAINVCSDELHYITRPARSAGARMRTLNPSQIKSQCQYGASKLLEVDVKDCMRRMLHRDEYACYIKHRQGYTVGQISSDMGFQSHEVHRMLSGPIKTNFIKALGI